MRLYAVAVGILGRGPDAAGPAQDAILIAERRLAGLRDPAAASSWVVAIVINFCRARLRRPAHELPRSEILELRGTLDNMHHAGRTHRLVSYYAPHR